MDADFEAQREAIAHFASKIEEDVQMLTFVPKYLEGWRESFEAWKRSLQPCCCILCTCLKHGECVEKRHKCCLVGFDHY